MRRFAAIAQRTRPRRAKRTGARYSPPPTPVKPERTPIGSAKRLPTASPSRRSARVPEGASKESSRRIGAPSTFRSLRLTHLSRLAIATRQTSKRWITATPIVRRTAPSRCPFKADGPNATPVHRNRASVAPCPFLRSELDMDIRTRGFDLLQRNRVRLAVREQGPRNRSDPTGFVSRFVAQDRVRRDQIQRIHHPAARERFVERSHEGRGFLRCHLGIRFAHRSCRHTRHPHTLPTEFPYVYGVRFTRPTATSIAISAMSSP